VAKRMMADVLWLAANEHLNVICTEDGFPQRVHKWSCWSVDSALGVMPGVSEFPNEIYVKSEAIHKAIAAHQFLLTLGLKSRPNENPICDLPAREQQGVRYLWLLIAMHVAEDEGIEL
jgi:hypothetical protein